MADSAVAITAGSGTNIDTRTEGTNGNHRQVIVLGDPATNAGVAPVDATAGLKVDLGADNDVVISDGGNVISVDDGGGSLTVDGTVTANLSATDNAVLDSIAVGTTGPAAATAINSFTSAIVDLAAGTADQSIVAAQGANTQIWVYGIVMKTNGTTATVVLEDSTVTTFTGTITLTDSDGFVMPPSGSFEMPWIKCATNTAFRADTTGSGTVDGIVTYAVVDVS